MTYVLITFLIVLGIYPFLLYPLTLVAARRLGLHRPVRRSDTPKGKVSVLLCCHNEERWIKRKLENLALLNSHETLVYADGCTDRTFDILEAWGGAARVFSDNVRRGKAHGMNILAERASGDILVFTDANVMLDEGALDVVQEYFADDSVGCVAGRLVYTNGAESPTARVGSLYWRLEEKIKSLESETGSVMGADGSLFAVRRTLFRPVPVDLIDDFYTSISILCRGWRVVHAREFLAFERSSTSPREEFRRKIRIACRVFSCHRMLLKQLLRLHPLDMYKYVSHRLLRWLSPFLLLIAGLLIAWELGPTGGLALAAALLLTGLGLRVRVPLVSSAANILLAFVATG